MSLSLRNILIFLSFSIFADSRNFVCTTSLEVCLEDIAVECNWVLDVKELNDSSHRLHFAYKDCKDFYNNLRKNIKNISLDGSVLLYKSKVSDGVWYKPEFISVVSIKKQLKSWLTSAIYKSFGFFDRTGKIFLPLEKMDILEALDVAPKQIHLQAILWVSDEHHKNTIGMSPHILTSLNLEDWREHLQFLESSGSVQVLAEPQLYVGLDHKAVVSSGEEIPYQTSDTKRSRIAFKKALLTLAVKAHQIGESGATLDVDIAFDKPSEHVYHGNVGIARQMVKTSLRLPFDKVIVMGGVLLQRQSVHKNCLPLLGDIPGMGFMFCENIHMNKKSFLYVMLSIKPMVYS